MEIPIYYIILSLTLHVLEISIILTIILIGVLSRMMTREELEEFVNELLEEEEEVYKTEREIDF